MRTALLFTIAVFLLSPAVAADDNAAFLFAYWPNEGQREQFDAGYRKHLDWHRKNNDPLPWYGWYVATGERTGMFVDGSFGITFEAFDNRIKPKEDAANFRETTAPYGKTAYRRILRHLPRLGTAARLEERQPSAGIEVVTFFVKPGRAGTFEACLEQLVAALGSAKDRPAFTVYRQLSGGAQPAYLVMFPREGYAYFENRAASLDALIKAHTGAETERELLALLSGSVQRTHSETWRYRTDLSRIPVE
ncbi:MAG TPA: hypothetical protein VF254_08645 [Gammaproteobacteria bacterium]